MLILEKSDPRSADSQYLIEKLSEELATITGNSGKSNFIIDSMDERRSVWVLAKNEQGVPVGCAALRPLNHHVAELKRMYSDRSIPGIGNALLSFLEKSAKSLGYSEIWLETRLVNHRAVAFYEKNGYHNIENYGPYIGRKDAVCFAKTLLEQVKPVRG